MQDGASELRRIPLPRTWVNNESESSMGVFSYFAGGRKLSLYDGGSPTAISRSLG
jgi:hypothetical protein